MGALWRARANKLRVRSLLGVRSLRISERLNKGARYDFGLTLQKIMDGWGEN